MFIQTETTPNPATLKFLPGKVVMPEGTADFRDADTAGHTSPLAAKLFSVPGVTGVFFGFDFITITKDGADWQHLKPAILGTIMEHFMAGAPVMAATDSNAASEHDEAEFFDEADTEIVGTIKELIETRVRPAVAQDGGDITFRGFEKGTVYLHMKGACSGCPSSTATLKHGIQNLLRHFVPEVQHVESV
ncbi:NifU family protein [Phyllobacterium salinisoli]|uniref:NifU family protein n=1 Tax=Phyllobacterium salinisoli TaxID=1899321 RepID=A0A368K8F4_9HYPH|nr:NifU family protein [Phyllobacterium salinisoli]RCS24895.1 NifU family protein [Phyllobacterium salinisoli]